MGDFDGSRWNIYLNQNAQDRRDKIIEYLRKNYDGPSDFVKQKLHEEDALTLDQKIKKFEQEIAEKEEKLKKFKQVKKEREQQDRLRDKKELLRDKQNRLREISKNKSKSEDVIREEVKQKLLNDKPASISKDEYLEGKSEIIDARVNHRMSSSLNIDELVEQVERLQEEIKELNGGSEDWFMEVAV